MAINLLPQQLSGVGSGGFQVVMAKGELNLVVNARYDAASGNWYRIDESKYSVRINLWSDANKLMVLGASPGSGAIVWSTMMNLYGGTIYESLVTGILTYSQATEPDIMTDSVALWEDTANNRYWLIWDKGGTQRKVELT